MQRILWKSGTVPEGMKFVEGQRTRRRVLRQLAVAVGRDPLTAQHRPASFPTFIRNVPDQLHRNQMSVKWGAS